MQYARRIPIPALRSTRKNSAGSGPLQRIADASTPVRQLKLLQSLADIGTGTTNPVAGNPPIQAKILRNIPKQSDSWSERATLGEGVAHHVRQFIMGKVAASPNQTIYDLLDKLDTAAWPNKHDEARVGAAKTAFEDLNDNLAGHDWGWLETQWSALDDRIEKLYMDLHKNKTAISGREWDVGRTFSDKIRDADEGETAAGSWRKHGPYGGKRSRIPQSTEHYAVGVKKTDSRAGPERVYVAPAKTEAGHEGVHAYYSPTHGNTNARSAKEYALVDNRQTIGGKRIVAPWDPYLK